MGLSSGLFLFVFFAMKALEGNWMLLLLLPLVVLVASVKPAFKHIFLHNDKEAMQSGD